MWNRPGPRRAGNTMKLTFRQYLEGIRTTDSSARELLSWGADDATDATSWPEALAALKRFRCSRDRIWSVRFLWQDYQRMISKSE
jgi:hypothetical protein